MINFRSTLGVFLIILIFISSIKLISSKKNYSLALYNILSLLPFVIRFWASGLENNLILFDSSLNANQSSIIFTLDILFRIFFIVILYFSNFSKNLNLDLIWELKVKSYYLTRLRKIRLFSLFTSLFSCILAFLIAGVDFLAINRLEILTSVNPLFKIIMPFNWCSSVLWSFSSSVSILHFYLNNKIKFSSFLRIKYLRFLIELVLISIPILLFNQRGVFVNMLLPPFVVITLLPSFRNSISKLFKYRFKPRFLISSLFILFSLILIIKARDLTNFSLRYLGYEKSQDIEQTKIFNKEDEEKDSLNNFAKKIIASPDGSYIDTWTIVNNYENDSSFTLNCSFLRFLPNNIRLNKLRCFTALDKLNAIIYPDYLEKYVGFNIWLSQELYWNLNFLGLFGIIFAQFLSAFLIVYGSNCFLKIISGKIKLFDLGIVLILIQTNSFVSDLGGIIQWTGFVIVFLSLFYFINPIFKLLKI